MDTQMINFTIPKMLLKTVDSMAQEEMKTRSELVRDALRDYLNRKLTLKKRWQQIFNYGASHRSKNLKIKEGFVENLVDAYREGK